jgi:putative ABC transport system substrate-binding protein
MIRRRDFITLLGGAAAWPFVAQAQQGGPVRRIGMLMGGVGNDPLWQSYTAAFQKGLAQFGWIEGRNLKIDLRFGEGDLNRTRAAAAEIVSLRPDAIFVTSATATRAVQQQTKTIPIVFAGAAVAGDRTPVQNIARPEGNVTGFQMLYPSMGSKWLELIKEAAPQLSKVAVIFSINTGVNSSEPPPYMAAIKEAATALRVSATPAPFLTSSDLENAIDSFASEPNGGLIILPSAATGTRDIRQLIFLMAGKHRMPAIHWDRSYPSEGGLMSYGSDFTDLNRRAAFYIDRILHGAKVNELPVQFPTRFELIINVRAAKAIGLTIPPAFLVLADEAIE